MSVLIEGGKVFYKGGFCEQDIQIENGRILTIGHKLHGDDKSIDARGLLILPGLIDPHVHLREPGWEYKEDFKTGSQAALAGGFTTIIDMPNNKIPTTTAQRLREKEELAKKKAVCNVRFHMGTTDLNFNEIRKAEPDSLKIYM